MRGKVFCHVRESKYPMKTHNQIPSDLDMQFYWISFMHAMKCKQQKLNLIYYRKLHCTQLICHSQKTFADHLFL